MSQRQLEPLPQHLIKFFDHLDANPKPNFTQYQLALDEIIRVFDYNDMVAAHASRRLRQTLEARFGLSTLDGLLEQ